MPLNLMGPVASVFARTTTRVNPIEVEDCAVASLVMQSRALARSPPHSALAPRDQSAALLLRRLRARDLRERACALFARRRPVADRPRLARCRTAHFRCAGQPPLPPVAVRGLDRRLPSIAHDRRQAADHRRRRPLLARARHRALPFGGSCLSRRPADRTRPSEVQWLAGAKRPINSRTASVRQSQTEPRAEPRASRTVLFARQVPREMGSPREEEGVELSLPQGCCLILDGRESAEVDQGGLERRRPFHGGTERCYGAGGERWQLR